MPMSDTPACYSEKGLGVHDAHLAVIEPKPELLVYVEVLSILLEVEFQIVVSFDALNELVVVSRPRKGTTLRFIWHFESVRSRLVAPPVVVDGDGRGKQY